MSGQADSKKICPYLGLAGDSGSRFGYPESAHRCFSADQETTIPAEHQAAFCLIQRYSACPRIVELPAETQATPATVFPTPETEIESPMPQSSLWQTILLGVAGLLAGLSIIFGIFAFSRFAIAQSSAPDTANQVEPAPLPASPTAELIPPEDVESTPTPIAVAVADTPTPTVTPDPDIQTITLSPAAADIGWVTDGEERRNHFGDSYLYAGIFDGQIYSGAFQFDLGYIPRGAPIRYAAIQMTGLRDDRLAAQNDQSDAAGVWTLRMLAPEVDLDWRRRTFQDIFSASALQTLSPILSQQDLAMGQTNTFELSSAQIKILEDRIIDDEEPKISFRIEGPLLGPDNLFAWDTGYGPQSQKNKVTLLLHVGLPPATPPPYDYILVTSTPTPENVMTAAAILIQTTAEATRVGTATPVPPNVVTPTPIPDYLVIVPTPTPENRATAQAWVDLATAQAVTTGTPTPVPSDAVTATPTPTETPTPVPSPPSYILITSTPTPETIFAAATQAVEATALAQRNGTPTPLPENWVTPIVVTATPTPLNEATAQAIADLAVAVALTTGTPTPTPPNMVTATSTPVFESIPLLLTPTPVPPTPVTPESMPVALLGKVLFLSDREGEEAVYAYDPDTGELGRLTDRWPYEMAMAREPWSADERFRVFTKDAIRHPLSLDNETELVPALFVYDYLYKEERQLTKHGYGIAYNGVWSPTSQEIAFVSNDSADDEIWVVNYDSSDIRQLTSSNEAYNAREMGKDTFIPELNKFPTWSPDGKQIVFASNRTKNLQLWIMNADGSDQKLLLGWDNWTPYNDWAPVWVKYLDPAPPEDKK